VRLIQQENFIFSLFLKTEIQSSLDRYGFNKRRWWTKYKTKFTV